MSQDQIVKCPKCGREMREGWLFIQVESSSALPPGMRAEGCGPFWAEYTGRTTGLWLKREETNAFPIRGLRCVNCAYIELYARVS